MNGMLPVFIIIGVAVAVLGVCLTLEMLRIDPARLIRRSAPPDPRRALTASRGSTS